MDNNTIILSHSEEAAEAMISLLGKSGMMKLEQDGIKITPEGVTQSHYTKHGIYQEPVSNFLITGIEQHNTISSDKTKYEISMTVVNTGTNGQKTAKICASKLSNPKWIIEMLGPKYQCYVYKVLKSVIDIFVANATTQMLCTCAGWGSNDYYIAGNVIIGNHPEDTIPHECLTGISFVCNAVSKNDTEKEDGINQITTLFKCTSSFQIKIMFLTTLLTIMTSLFRRNYLSIVPNFTIVLVGASGTGKTTVMKALFSFYSKLSRLDMSMGFTKAAFYKLAEVIKDHPLWLDDLVSGDDSIICETVNSVLRAAGNSGSSRVTANGKSSVESLVFMTMEVVPDTLPRSSVDRMLVVEIEKDEVNFDITKQFFDKNVRMTYSRAINDIISYIIEQNPDKVATSIYKSFIENRQKLHINPDTKGCSDRHLEDYAWILAANHFFIEYHKNSIPMGEDHSNDNLFNYVVKELKEEAIEMKVTMPEYMFSCKIVECIGKFQARKLAEELKPGSYGFHDEDYFFITEMSLNRILSDLGLSQNKSRLLKQLRTLGILVPEIGRGLKYRLFGENRKLIVYRFSKENINNFISAINNETDCPLTEEQYVTDKEDFNDNK